MKTSDLKHIIKEALSEDESKAVLDKYKKRYAAVLKSNPKFIKKYSNPDAVIYGMVMNEVKKLREKLGKNSRSRRLHRRLHEIQMHLNLKVNLIKRKEIRWL